MNGFLWIDTVGNDEAFVVFVWRGSYFKTDNALIDGSVEIMMLMIPSFEIKNDYLCVSTQSYESIIFIKSYFLYIFKFKMMLKFI
jgi:hypothetical protein